MSLYSTPDIDDHLVLTDRIALRLGRMAMRFAAVESMTRWHLLRILDVEDDAEDRIEAILGELTFRKLRAALVAAVRDQAPNDEEGRLAALRAIVIRIARLEERRNTLTHSSWNHSNLPAELVREKRHVSAGGAIRKDTEAFRDIAQLDQLVAELDQVGSDLSRWYMQYYLRITPGAA